MAHKHRNWALRAIPASVNLSRSTTHHPMTSTLLPKALAAHITDTLQGGAARHWEVLATPGSGKTTLIVHLMSLLVHRVGPEGVLVLSFANSTVDTVKERVALYSATEAPSPKVVAGLMAVKTRTFHSFALTVMSHQHAKVLLGDFVLDHVRVAVKRVARKYLKADAGEGLDDLSDALRTLIDDRDGHELLLKIFDLSRATGEAPEVVAKRIAGDALDVLHPVLPAMLKAYGESLTRSGHADFAKILQDACDGGDMPQYLYVLVDEYQDCTAAQRLLLAKLAEAGAHIIVVGDGHQALYGFNGAEPARLRSFLPDVEESHLNRSFRLTRETAALANAIGRLSADSRIRTKKIGERPVFVQSATYWALLEALTDRVRALIASGVDPCDIAVLGRTNQLLKDCEDHLLRGASINTARRGSTLHPGAVETVIRLAMTVRRLARTGADAVAADDVKAAWRYGPLPEDAAIGRGMAKLSLALGRAKAKPGSYLDSIFRPCADAFFSIVGRGGDAFKEVRNEVAKWEPIAATHASGTSLLQHFSDLNAQARVTTSTIHGAKGMEWQHVLVVGVTEGLCPIYHVKPDDKFGLQQERNALFVAVTRAVDSVTLFHAPRSHGRSRRLFDEPSQFMKTKAVRQALNMVES